MAAHSTIGIVGAGEIGRAVADKAVRQGHEVLIGNSRGPETLKAVVEQLGPKAHAVTAEEAAQPDLIFLAVPFFAVPDLTSLTDWSRKIVVDTTNQFAEANPWRGRYDVGDLTGSEWVAERLPGARIVKAFNSLFAAFIAADLLLQVARRQHRPDHPRPAALAGAGEEGPISRSQPGGARHPEPARCRRGARRDDGAGRGQEGPGPQAGTGR
ncbi:NAD(P)-binding domain-containing protein [Streptomyces sp. NBC_00365]|nr:NAD(P)-binding domain-containing protein [Streptomyces sp. NBC_00365]